MGLIAFIKRIFSGQPARMAQSGQFADRELAAEEYVLQNGQEPDDVYEVFTEPSDALEETSWEDPFRGLAVAVPVEEQIDLHTFAPDETEEVLDAYLEAAWDKGFRRLRIIHGRGRGVQRRIVQAYLGRHHYVDRFRDAPAEEGGWGATIVFLKN